jgi:AraC family transcriptional regulator
MTPRYTSIKEKKLVGVHLRMSVQDNRTRQLWSSLMPRLNEVEHRLGSDLYNLQVYDAGFHDQFDPTREYEAWALAEVADHKKIPAGLSAFTLPAGKYAIFLHKGGPATGAQTYRFIFNEWLPNSGYELDDRPHFEILGKKYSNNDPESEEEIWLPVK